MSPVFSKRECKELLFALSYEAGCNKELIDLIGERMKPRRSVTAARVRRKAKKAEQRDEMTSIREAVFARSGPCCECGCEVRFTDWDQGELDHFLGGANRRTLQSKYTCWRLVRECHRRKTLNEPIREYWLNCFVQHCEFMHELTHDEGYERAREIAQRKLDVLRIQGSTEARP